MLFSLSARPVDSYGVPLIVLLDQQRRLEFESMAHWALVPLLTHSMKTYARLVPRRTLSWYPSRRRLFLEKALPWLSPLERLARFLYSFTARNSPGWVRPRKGAAPVVLKAAPSQKEKHETAAPLARKQPGSPYGEERHKLFQNQLASIRIVRVLGSDDQSNRPARLSVIPATGTAAGTLVVQLIARTPPSEDS